MRHKLLIAGLAAMVSLFYGMCLWEIGGNILSLYAAGPNAPTDDPGRGLPPMVVIQATMTPSRPADAAQAPAGALLAPAPAHSPANEDIHPETINGLAVDQWVVLPSAVKQNILGVYARGVALGRNPRAFSKIGDSNMENPFFLAPFDDEAYNLGKYAHLEPAIHYFAGSFGRQSLAVKKGFHSWSVLDATLADRSACWPD